MPEVNNNPFGQIVKDAYSQAGVKYTPTDDDIQTIQNQYKGDHRTFLKDFYKEAGVNYDLSDDDFKSIDQHYGISTTVQEPVVKNDFTTEQPASTNPVVQENLTTDPALVQLQDKQEAPDKEESGFWSTWVGDAMQGFSSTTMDIVGNMAALTNLPMRSYLNYKSKEAGISNEERKIFVDSFLESNPITNRGEQLKISAKEEAEKLEAKSDRYNGEDFVDLWKKGQYGAVAGDIFLQGAKSLPYMIMAMGGGGGGLMAIGTTSAAGKYEQLDNPELPELFTEKQKADYISQMNMGEFQKLTNSALTGTSEAASELLGSVPMGRYIGRLVAKAGKPAAQEIIQKGISGWVNKMFDRYGLLLGPVSEGIEEVANSLATDVVDRATGATTELDAMEMVSKAAKSFVYGVGGGSFGSIGAGAVMGYNKLNGEQNQNSPVPENQTNLTVDPNIEREALIQQELDYAKGLAHESGNVIKAKDNQGRDIFIKSGDMSDTDGLLQVVYEDGTPAGEDGWIHAGKIEDHVVSTPEAFIQPNIDTINAEFESKQQEDQYKAENTMDYNGQKLIRIPDGKGKSDKGESWVNANGELVELPNEVVQDWEKSKVNTSNNNESVTGSPNGDSELKAETPTERKIITQAFGNTSVDIARDNGFDEVIPTEKMPLEKALPILEKKFKDNKKFELQVEKSEVEVRTPGETIYDDEIVEKKPVIKSIRIVPRQTTPEKVDTPAEKVDTLTPELTDKQKAYQLITGKPTLDQNDLKQADLIPDAIAFKAVNGRMEEGEIQVYRNLLQKDISVNNIDKNQNKVSENNNQEVDNLINTLFESSESLQNKKLQNEESEKSYPEIKGQEPVSGPGENTPQEEQGETNEEGLEKNVNIDLSIPQKFTINKANKELPQAPLIDSSIIDWEKSGIPTDENNDWQNIKVLETRGITPDGFIAATIRAKANGDTQTFEVFINISTDQPATESLTADPVADQKETRDQLENRLLEERKQRILTEGTGFDKEFGLIPPSDIKSADDIISNIDKILSTLKENQGNKKFDIFEGYVYGSSYAKNAGEQIRGYFHALDVLPNEIRKEFASKINATTVQELMDWASKKYKDIIPVAEQIAQQGMNLNPSEAQKEAGNYKKAHVTIQGMDIAIENPKGSFRKGVDEDGRAWETEMKSHYGYFKRTNGKDGDHIDTFIGESPSSEKDNPAEELDSYTDENTEMSAEEEAEGIEQAQKLTDFGQKIGMARKDVAEKGFTRLTKSKEKEQPAWAKKYKVFDQKNIAVVERWGRRPLDPDKFSIAIVKGRQFRTIRENIDSEQEAYDMIPLIEVAINHRVYSSEKNKDQFSIYRKWSSGKLFEIKKGFESKDEAMKYMAEHPQEIINYKTARVERPHLDSIERIGPERRKGNVTPKQFMDTFGLRAGEFGNWVAGDERQEMLNFAYDAFADMAEVLGVPYRAISLNGRLAIGFGSRGQGLSGASAHFEPGRGVINLTKMSGAGALAHEWFHAFDSYFGFKGKSDYKPNEAGVIPVSNEVHRDYLSGDNFKPREWVRTEGGKGVFEETVRPEVVKAWKAVWDAMRYKTEQSTYDKKKAQQRIDYGLESLLSSLNSSKTWLTQDRTYGIRKKAATPEQIKKWDALIERLKVLDFGEVTEKKTKKRFSFDQQYDVQKQLDDLYKEVTGRGLSDYTIDYNKLRSIKLQEQQVELANKGETFENKVPTTFYRESVQMDKVRASSYWSTNHEMSARAFEAFMDDQIKSTGFKNDYLVHSVNNAVYQMLYDCKPYPESEERTKINEAFKELFNTIKTKIEGDNVPLFRILGETGAANLDKAEEATTRLDNLAIAREMETSGKDAKSIRLATGWEKGVDGKWRYEVPDNIEIKDYDAVNLGYALGHDHELFRTYPRLRYIEIGALSTEEDQNNGMYYPAKVMGPKPRIFAGGIDEENLKSVLAHEIQHAIQEIEGFAQGGNTNTFTTEELYKKARELNLLGKGFTDEQIKHKAYSALAGEVESRNVQTRMNMTPEERLNTLLSETEDVAREDQIVLMEGLGVSNSTNNKPSFTEVQSKVDELQSNAPSAAPIEVILDKNGLPEEIKNHKNFSDDIEAVRYKGRIYILADKVRSIDDLVLIWIHENGIHNGLRNIIPSGELMQFMGNVYDSFTESGKNNPQFQQIIERVNRDYPYATKEQKAEEMLAYLSEKVVSEQDLTPMEQSLWKKYLDMFRDFMRRLFNFNSQLLTEKQIVEITRFAVQSNFQENELANNNTRGSGSLRTRTSNNTNGSEGRVNESGKLQDATGERLSSDIRSGRIFQRDSTERKGLDRTLPLSDYLEEAKRVVSEKKENLSLGDKPNDMNTGRTPIRVDQYGKQIVWENEDYFVSVNDVDNATYAALWNNGKKVGELFTTPGRNSNTKGYLSIQNVTIDKKHQGQGLSKQLYNAILDNLGVKYKGISSENEQRSNKKQVPNIWRRLGVKITDGDYTVEKKQSQLPNTILIYGVSRPTLNSNGKPIANSEEGIRNFYRWFQNSKVVDAEGRPLVVYHGTGTEINEFKKTSSLTARNEHYNDDFIYLTKNKEQAKDYAFISGLRTFAENNDLDIDYQYLNLSGNASKYESEINDYIESKGREIPEDLDEWREYAQEFFDDWQERESVYNVMEIYVKLENPKIVTEEVKGTQRADVFDIFNTEYESGKYDGAIFNNIFDFNSSSLGSGQGSTIIATSPSQIKSATGNNGSFDPDNSDIRFRKTPLENKLDERAEILDAAGQAFKAKPAGKKTTMQVLQSVRDLVQEKDGPIYRWQKTIIEKMGGKLTDEANPFRDKKLAPGRLQNLTDQFTNEYLNPLIDISARISQEVGKQTWIEPYLIAKHAPERNATIRAGKLEEWKNKNFDMAQWIKENNPTDEQLQTMTEQLIAEGKYPTDQEIDEKTNELLSMDFSGILPMNKDKNGKVINEEFEKDPDALANAIVEQFEKVVSPELVKELNQKRQDISDAILSAQVAANKITQKEANDYKSRWKYYVPLRGWMDDAAKQYTYTTSNSGAGSVNKHAGGRTSLAESPLGYLHKLGFRSISEKVDQEVKQSLLRFIANNYSPEFKKMYQVKQAYFVKDGTDPETGETLWTITTEKPSEEKFESGDAVTETYKNHMKLRTIYHAKEHEVVINRADGSSIVIVFDRTDPNLLEVAQAFNNNNVMFGIGDGAAANADILNAVVSQPIPILPYPTYKDGHFSIKVLKTVPLRNFTNFVKSMLTQFNLKFPITNFPRDFAESNMDSYIVNGKLIKGTTFKKSMKAINSYLMGKPDKTGLREEVINFFSNGGTTGYTHDKSPQEYQEEILGEIDSLVKNGLRKSKSKKLSEWLTRYNQRFEDSVRFAVYLNSRNLGFSVKDSCFRSRNATVDFNIRGKLSPILGTMYGFFEVSVTSLAKTAGYFTGSSIMGGKNRAAIQRRAIKTATAFVMLGFIDAMINDWMYPDDDDDDDNNYYNRSRWMRHNYINIPVPFKSALGIDKLYFSIALPPGWRTFKGLGAVIYDYAIGQRGKLGIGEAIGSTAMNFIDGFSPVPITNVYQDGEWHPESLFVPMAFKPWYEISINKNFMGARIAKKPFTEKQEQEIANSALGKDNVNVAAKFFTDILFKAGGGDSQYKMRFEDDKRKEVWGIFDWNPSKIEHIFSGYGGGTLDTFSDLMKTAFATVSPDKEVDFKDMPFVNAFIRKTPEAKWTTINEYYKLFDEIKGLDSVTREYEKQAIGSGDLTSEKADKYRSVAGSNYLQTYKTTLDVYKKLIDTLSEHVNYKTGEGTDPVIDMMKQATEAINELKIQNKAK